MDVDPLPEDPANFLQSSKLYESYHSSGKVNMVALMQNGFAKKVPLIMLIEIGNLSTTLLLDSWSACRIFNQSFPAQVVKSSPHAFLVRDNSNLQLGSSSNEPILVEVKYKPRYRATARLRVRLYSLSSLMA